MKRTPFIPAILVLVSLACGCSEAVEHESNDDDAALADLFAGGPKADDVDDVLRVRAVGDIMMGTDFPSTDYLPPRDGEGIFDGMIDPLDGPTVTLGNLEGPLCDGGGTDKCGDDTSNCYAFRTPTRYADHLVDAGFDVFSIANNHALDFREECRQQTITALEERSFAWSGPPGTIGTVQTEHGLVGVIAFHTAQHSNWLNDHEAAADLVRTADEDHDVVIVTFHGGAEGSAALNVPDARETYYGEDRGHLRAFARDVIDAGADLVLGHGPHVPRGLEVYRERLIAYSLGNFATYGRFSLRGPKGVSLVLETALDDEGTFRAARIHPARLINGGYPVADPDGESIELIRRLSAEDFPQTAPRFLDSGIVAPPE